MIKGLLKIIFGDKTKPINEDRPSAYVGYGEERNGWSKEGVNKNFPQLKKIIKNYVKTLPKEQQYIQPILESLADYGQLSYDSKGNLRINDFFDEIVIFKPICIPATEKDLEAVTYATSGPWKMDPKLNDWVIDDSPLLKHQRIFCMSKEKNC